MKYAFNAAAMATESSGETFSAARWIGVLNQLKQIGGGLRLV